MSDRYEPDRPTGAKKAGHSGLRIQTGPRAGAAPDRAPSPDEFARHADLLASLVKVLGGRIAMLRFIRQLHARPPADRGEGLDRLRADHRQMAETLLTRMATTPDLVRRLDLAIGRFELASARSQAAAAAVERLQAGAPLGPDDLDLPGLRRDVHLMTTFDLQFRDDPVLRGMFPEVDRGRPAERPPAERAGPKAAPVRPAAPRAVPRPPAPEGGGLVRELVRIFKESFEAAQRPPP